jgi:hypothetical protein
MIGEHGREGLGGSCKGGGTRVEVDISLESDIILNACS